MKKNDIIYFLYVIFYLSILPGLVFLAGLQIAVMVPLSTWDVFLDEWFAYFLRQNFFLLTFPFWIVFGLFFSRCLCKSFHGHYVPDSYLIRYLPFYLPLLYFLAVLSYYFILGEETYGKTQLIILIMLSHLHYSGLVFPLAFLAPWCLVYVGVTLFLSYGIGGSLFIRYATNEPTKHQAVGTKILLILLILPTFWVVWNCYKHYQNTLPIDLFTPMVSDQEERSYPNALYNSPPPPLKEYRPFTGNNKLATIETPSLKLESGVPSLCGSPTLFPLYAAAAQAVFPTMTPGDAEYVIMEHAPYHHSNDDSFGCSLSDIFFTMQPTDVEKSKQIPIAKDALVFFVHNDNPLNDITIDTLRDIYGKRITTWKTILGGKGGLLASRRILPFQNDPKMESQQSFVRFMQGFPLAEPLRMEYYAFIGGYSNNIVPYRNYKNAIGFSSRFFIDELCPLKNEIKVLHVNGVKPTKENIKNGTYPIIETVYALYADPPKNPQTQEFVDWLASPQGQELVEKASYVPYYKP